LSKHALAPGRRNAAERLREPQPRPHSSTYADAAAIQRRGAGIYMASDS